jgi:hypothetical protein
MSRDFIPRSDAELLEFITQFSTKISATPTAYGLTAGDATQLATAKTTYATAYAAATDPATRGQSTIFAKDTARAALVALTRVLARQIQGTRTVTNQQRLDLGLTVRAVSQPIPAPNRAPGIEVVSVNGRTVRVRIFDPQNLARRGRPPGVDGVSVFSFVGATAPEDPTLYKFEGSTTLSVFDVQFPLSVAEGAKVWLTAFYFNPRSQSGPGCTPQSAYLQFGGDLPIAA